MLRMHSVSELVLSFPWSGRDQVHFFIPSTLVPNISVEPGIILGKLLRIYRCTCTQSDVMICKFLRFSLFAKAGLLPNFRT
jgi:hypothetical protein